MDSLYRTDFSNKKNLEKYSSAFTLSDIEVFVFPDLLYPLVYANIMSPVIWKWKDDPWFENIDEKSFIYKINRIKQYIIQNYIFNLDLATWGLTTKTREIERFRDFIDIDLLRQSNALFGYEGDKYYFDIDIRKHFGLDKYDSEIIPYWKTETVEAMEAFRFRKGFTTGAGECVSLSALYAAAMFIIAKIPLDKIFLIATPLHSQDFIMEKEGVLTNNRRILTKNMWFNGTSLSAKARRALENEKVTIVSNSSGYIHLLYNEATINRDDYRKFSTKLREFLKAELNPLLFTNFLRFKSKYISLFQLRCDRQNSSKFISLEKIFEYEHNSKFNAVPDTRCLLLEEIEGEEFHLSPIPDKLLLNDFEQVLKNNIYAPLDIIEKEFIKISGEKYSEIIREMMHDIYKFLNTEPSLPDENKKYINVPYPKIDTNRSREEIIEEIRNMADISEMCLLALYTYRAMDIINWLPFVRAAIERNPVCIDKLDNLELDYIYRILLQMPSESIYDGKRLALPDEVWNFERGDGIEKAFLLADTIICRDINSEIKIIIDNTNVELIYSGRTFKFNSNKQLQKLIEIRGNNYKIE